MSAEFRLIVRSRGGHETLICLGHSVQDIRDLVDFALQDYDESDAAKWYSAHVQQWYEPGWYNCQSAEQLIKVAMRRNKRIRDAQAYDSSAVRRTDSP